MRLAKPKRRSIRKKFNPDVSFANKFLTRYYSCENFQTLYAVKHLQASRPQMPETLIVAFDGKATHTFTRAEKRSFSVFGGPREFKITGKRPVADKLHYIARLNHNDLPILGSPSYVFDLPLLYGLRYLNGNLSYQFKNRDISIHSSPGTFDEGWPYRDYPTLLPYIPVAVSKKKKQTWRQFAAEFPNMKEQQPSELVVIVPPPMTIGVSVWGRAGDAEGVAMVFECDLTEMKVSTYNVCT